MFTAGGRPLRHTDKGVFHVFFDSGNIVLSVLLLVHTESLYPVSFMFRVFYFFPV